MAHGKIVPMINWLAPGSPFPSIDDALTEPNGLLAAGLELTPGRILQAYRQGIFPWFNPGDPVLWWSPDPRMVLMPSEFKLARSLRQRMKKGGYEIRVDTAFREVMEACAEARQDQTGTWIGQWMVDAYTRLHEMGFAHSIETWVEGELAGGLYGLAIGRMFYGESMFTRRTDASKLALAHLCRQLETWDFGLIDCQMETPHLASLGAKPIPRKAFIQELKRLVELAPVPSPWRFACIDASH
jgi:leucyl/phenylalanyl-tRNA--protein transferase